MTIRQELFKEMRDTLEKINIYYSGSTLSDKDKALFDLSSNVLEKLDRHNQFRKITVDNIDLDMVESWKKHIYVKFEGLCEDYGYSTKEIRSKKRTRNLVDIRQKIAKTLFKDNFNKSKISWVMDRDHTSICHLIDVRKAA